jgi:hypothetical protein
MTGAVMFIIFKVISSGLNIDSAIVPQPHDRSRTAAEFRAARREKKEDLLDFPHSSTPVVLKKASGSRRKGLLSQAIMEEEDSDFWEGVGLVWRMHLQVSTYGDCNCEQAGVVGWNAHLPSHSFASPCGPLWNMAMQSEAQYPSVMRPKPCRTTIPVCKLMGDEFDTAGEYHVLAPMLVGVLRRLLDSDIWICKVHRSVKRHWLDISLRIWLRTDS